MTPTQMIRTTIKNWLATTKKGCNQKMHNPVAYQQNKYYFPDKLDIHYELFLDSINIKQTRHKT